MADIKIILCQGEAYYRFLDLKARPDGSLILLVDRDASAIGSSHSIDTEGRIIQDDLAADLVLAHAKFSIHTTGVINYYPHTTVRKATGNAGCELIDLKEFVQFGLYSIPALTRLDPVTPTALEIKGTAIVHAPPELIGRITFFFEVGPLSTPSDPDSVALQLNYEAYSLVLRVGPAPTSVSELPAHFLVGFIEQEALAAAPIVQPDAAELRFHQRVHQGKPPIFRNGDGSYTTLAAVVMRIPPKLRVEFDRSDLELEQVPFDYGSPSHKVRFWIRDRGGRNKRHDLRCHIVSLTMDARMH